MRLFQLGLAFKAENPVSRILQLTALRRSHRSACMRHDVVDSAAESRLVLTHHLTAQHSRSTMATPASRAGRRCSGRIGLAGVGRFLRSTTPSRSGMIAPSTLNRHGSYSGRMGLGTRRIRRRRASNRLCLLHDLVFAAPFGALLQVDLFESITDRSAMRRLEAGRDAVRLHIPDQLRNGRTISRQVVSADRRTDDLFPLVIQYPVALWSTALALHQ